MAAFSKFYEDESEPSLVKRLDYFSSHFLGIPYGSIEYNNQGDDIAKTLSKMTSPGEYQKNKSRF